MLKTQEYTIGIIGWSFSTMTQEEEATRDESIEESSVTIRVVDDDQELLRYGICRAKIPQGLDAERWAKELSQLTPMNIGFEGDSEFPLYRNIMEEPDFPFDCLLDQDSDIGMAILRHFPIQRLSEIRLDDAFCVHYNMDQNDTTGARHTDPSDITVNICLQKSDDTEESHVLFYGTRKLENVALHSDDHLSVALDASAAGDHTMEAEKFLVRQEPGYATIHYGDHPHETTALRRGSRTNIVATYWYTDPGRSDVATRTCY